MRHSLVHRAKRSTLRKLFAAGMLVLGPTLSVVGNDDVVTGRQPANAFESESAEGLLAQNQPTPPGATRAPTAPPAVPNTTPRPPRPNTNSTPNINQLAQAPQPQAQANRFSLSSMPYMIGDAFGGGTQSLQVTNTVFTLVAGPVTTVNQFTIPSGTSGGVVGQTKLVEGFSPIPQDRVYFNYSYFNQVPLSATGVNVNRFTPGFETTFWDRQASVEFRTPMASTLDSTISGNGATLVNHPEFGDLFTSVKFLLLADEQTAFTGGMSLTAPTANDILFTNAPGSTIQELRIHNDAVHLQPFLAMRTTPTERTFFQGLFQVDVPTSGNRVTGQFIGQGPQNIGTLTNQTYCNVSVSTGFWLYQARHDRLVTGVAPLVEAHYSQTLSGANNLTFRDGPPPLAGTSTTVSLGNRNYQFQLVNLTVGANVQLGPATTMLMGYSTPLGGGTDRQFNGEFRLMLNRRFGPQSNLARVPF